MTLLAIFLSGAAIEAMAVIWVRYSEQGRWFAAALASMAQATAQVFGVVECVHDWRQGPAFVLGYGFGTAVAVVARRAS